jgi:hypothetical protein
MEPDDQIAAMNMNKSWRRAFFDTSSKLQLTVRVSDVTQCDRMSAEIFHCTRNLSIGRNKPIDTFTILYAAKHCPNLHTITVETVWDDDDDDKSVRRDPAALESAFKSAGNALARVRKLNVTKYAQLSAALNRFVGACTTLEQAHVEFLLQWDANEALPSEFIGSLSTCVRELHSNVYQLSNLQPLIALADRGVRLETLVFVCYSIPRFLEGVNIQQLETELTELRCKHPEVNVKFDCKAETALVPIGRLSEFFYFLQNYGIVLRTIRLTTNIRAISDRPSNDIAAILSRIRLAEVDSVSLHFDVASTDFTTFSRLHISIDRYSRTIQYGTPFVTGHNDQPVAFSTVELSTNLGLDFTIITSALRNLRALKMYSDAHEQRSVTAVDYQLSTDALARACPALETLAVGVCRDVSQFQRALFHEDVQFDYLKSLTLSRLRNWYGKFPSCAPALRTICFDDCVCEDPTSYIQFLLSLVDKCHHVTTIVIRNELSVPSTFDRNRHLSWSRDTLVQLLRGLSQFAELHEISFESSSSANVVPWTATAFQKFSKEPLESLRTCKQLRRIRFVGMPSGSRIHPRFISELQNISFIY